MKLSIMKRAAALLLAIMVLFVMAASPPASWIGGAAVSKASDKEESLLPVNNKGESGKAVRKEKRMSSASSLKVDSGTGQDKGSEETSDKGSGKTSDSSHEPPGESDNDPNQAGQKEPGSKGEDASGSGDGNVSENSDGNPSDHGSGKILDSGKDSAAESGAQKDPAGPENADPDGDEGRETGDDPKEDISGSRTGEQGSDREQPAAGNRASDSTLSSSDADARTGIGDGSWSSRKNTDTGEKSAKGDKKNSFDAKKTDELAYHLLYFAGHADPAYVDVSQIELSDMIHPVTVARGLATYNVKKQKEFAVTSNFLAGITYELPVYDIDSDSDYYAALPNVNLGSNDLAAYDLALTYNNDNGETIRGWHYKDQILYIPRKVIDHPANEEGLIGSSPVAVQLNYAFGGLTADKEGNADFGKTLPVQILSQKKGKPVNRKVHIDNIFDSQVLIPDVTGKNVRGREYGADDFCVFLNGMMMPAARESWDYVDGDIIIHSPAAIISNVNILYKEKTRAGKLLKSVKAFFGPDVYAGTKVSMKDMKYYKNKKGKYVTVDFGGSNMFVGWRGYYSADLRFVGTDKNDNANYNYLKEHADYEELKNSAYYLYGGYGTGRNASKNDAAWAIESYCVGANKAVDVSDKLSADKKIHENDDSSGETKTIYEWMIKYRNYLEKSIGGWGGGSTNYAEGSGTSGLGEGSVKGVTESGDDHISNGVGGSTDFAFKVPVKIKGSDDNLVSSGSEGHGLSNGNVNFSSDQLSENAYFAAGCTHLDEVAASDSDGAKTVYVACLGYDVDDQGQRYVILAFSSADKGSTGQEACAVYKFKTTSPVAVKKVSSLTGISSGNACYGDLSGAKYGLYESRTDAEAGKDQIAALTTKKDGVSNEVFLPKGTYYVKELSAPKNYALNTDILTIKTDSSNETQIFNMPDPPRSNPIDLLLVKVDSETGKAESQGRGSLAGAEFSVSYYDNEEGNVTGTAKRTWVFKTDEKGEIHFQDPAYLVKGDAFYQDSTGRKVIPIGTVAIRETRAPEGYVPAGGSEPVIQKITGTGTAETLTVYAAKTVPNRIIRGGVQIRKEDSSTGEEAQGDGTFAGITFAIINENSRPVRVDGKDRGAGEVVKTIVADEKGLARTGAADLPFGDYSIKESETNEGYLLTDGKARSFQIREDGKMVEISESCQDEIVRGDVEIEKLDIETDTRVPLGFATHVGTSFTISNRSAHPVMVDDTLFEPGEVCKTITLSEEKVMAATSGRTLPYGTYSIKEVAVGQGYLLTDGRERSFQIRKDGQTVRISKEGDVKEPFRNQVKRGDFNFIKVLEDADSDRNMNALALIPFEVYSNTTGEKHIVVTDENGQFNSQADWIPHSSDTNANDAALKEDGTVDEDKLNPEAGLWFDTDREGNKAGQVDDNLGALPYDTYTMNELPCKANEGVRRIKNRVFTIRVDKRNVSLGTIDDPGGQKIRTEARDGGSGSHQGVNSSDRIIDRVIYEGLTAGQEYTMTGVLIDKETEKEVEIDGKTVTAKKTFTPESSSGELEMEFAITEESMAGRSIVVFESCESGGVVIASHEDIDDEAQTVTYEDLSEPPKIRTNAVDSQTGTHQGKLSSTITIQDKVSYYNLTPGQTYTLTGRLYNKATGKVIRDALGQPYTVTKIFTPQAKDGTVMMSFKLAGNQVSGKSLVAFESLWQEEKELAVHADITDEAQTVTYPQEEKETPKVITFKTPASKIGSTVRRVITSPKTGDRTRLVFFILILFLSGTGLLTGLLIRFRKRKQVR